MEQIYINHESNPVGEIDFHIHTSNSDGENTFEEMVEMAKKRGLKDIAITDHNGVYAIPDVAHAVEKLPDFKPIYGVELSYVDDDKYFITFDKRDIELKDATYVVFDIETTGLSVEYDSIIEIDFTIYINIRVNNCV